MFNNFGYNGTAAADFNGAPFNLKGGRFVIGGVGGFGGGSLALQITTDNDVTWTPIGSQNGVATAITAAGTSAFSLPPGRYRVALTGSTTPTLSWFAGEANAG